MIEPFALEPQAVASWVKKATYRFLIDSFGLGTPRVMLELPTFKKWKRELLRAAETLDLSPLEARRVDELLQVFEEHRCRRIGAVYDGLRSWLENAEDEHARQWFRAIVASENPRAHPAVLVSAHIDPSKAPWACPTSANPARTPEGIAAVLAPMLTTCRVLHLIDPYFGKPDHRRVLAELMCVLADHEVAPEEVKIHCADRGATLAYFEGETKKMIQDLPSSITVSFVRLKERPGRDKLHNRYVLTDLGGVSFGIGLDAGDEGQTDDVQLLSRELYQRRWKQYVMNDGTFEVVDTPAAVRGALRPVGDPPRHPRRSRRTH